MRRAADTLVVLSLGLAAILTAASTTAAQTWPTGPVRIIVPFPPGGTTDQIARRVQPSLQTDLKVPVIVENRGGASGSIGTQVVVTSPPDGTTFLLAFDSLAANPSLLPNLPYDTLRDLTPVMMIGTSPMMIAAHPATAYASFADLVAAAQKSDAVNYGTIGTGSLAHLTMSLIANRLKVTMTHVPYRGGGPLLSDAIAGHVPLAVASVALLSAQISSGGLRALAVTSAARYSDFTDVPGMTDLGLDVDAQAWWGLLAPAGTPAAIIARMHRALVTALDVDTVRLSLSEQGVVYRVSSPDEFGHFLEAEITRWAKVVKDNRIVANE